LLRFWKTSGEKKAKKRGGVQVGKIHGTTSRMRTKAEEGGLGASFSTLTIQVSPAYTVAERKSDQKWGGKKG